MPGPMGFLMDLAICNAKGLVIIMILLWVIGKIPFIGPYVKSGITWVFTKIAEYAGIANCGYTNSFEKIVESENNKH